MGEYSGTKVGIVANPFSGARRNPQRVAALVAELRRIGLEPVEMWGREEVWSYPEGIGDCEDYALEKRRQLMALGVPAGDLLLTVVRQPSGAGHAVLTMRTSRGEFVLDNLEPRVLAWTDTEYTFLKRQSERNSGVWVQINDGRADAVASVR